MSGSILAQSEILASVQPRDVKKYYSNLKKHKGTRLMSKVGQLK